MPTFKITWPDHTVVMLSGSDEDEALSLAGYTDADRALLIGIHEVTPGDSSHDDYPYVSCTCPSCDGILELTGGPGHPNYGGNTYWYVCQDCTAPTPRANNEERALVAMNIYCATGNVPTSQQVTAAIKKAHEEKDDDRS